MASRDKVAADKFMKAWASGDWIAEPSEFPPAPADLEGVYATHLSMQTHPLATSTLGGLAGYKIGACGAITGQPGVYAPLFGLFVVEAPGDELSSVSIQMHQIEPEFVAIMGDDLSARGDGRPHTVEEVWAAVESIALSVECCGQRSSPEVVAGLTTLGKFSDCLNAGGVVLGPRVSPRTVGWDALSRCETELIVNGISVAKGAGSECPEGGPAQALAWMANHLNARGLVLQKGMIVATGQTCNYRDFQPGDRVIGDFGELGKVDLMINP
eukprot:CAMPEP_0198206828 /NCGR_PEP_ID=MMETSP1445-20131203/10357_1 /TAXON_ID=36898 /ORGANISM="Pyramimonas sp., Strain CCMP2087" /LENGTH=269 /DNA_ID=CAMNT_0043879671 /DNA_START=232 /DNA_END=1041 /DNA_ORIENTATION=-